jgi:hypothetical protein
MHISTIMKFLATISLFLSLHSIQAMAQENINADFIHCEDSQMQLYCTLNKDFKTRYSFNVAKNKKVASLYRDGKSSVLIKGKFCKFAKDNLRILVDGVSHRISGDETRLPLLRTDSELCEVIIESDFRTGPAPVKEFIAHLDSMELELDTSWIQKTKIRIKELAELITTVEKIIDFYEVFNRTIMLSQLLEDNLQDESDWDLVKIQTRKLREKIAPLTIAFDWLGYSNEDIADITACIKSLENVSVPGKFRHAKEKIKRIKALLKSKSGIEHSSKEKYQQNLDRLKKEKLDLEDLIKGNTSR